MLKLFFHGPKWLSKTNHLISKENCFFHPCQFQVPSVGDSFWFVSNFACWSPVKWNWSSDCQSCVVSLVFVIAIFNRGEVCSASLRCKSHVDIFSSSNWMMFTMKKGNTAAKHAKVASGVSHVLHMLRLEDGPLHRLPKCLTFYVVCPHL